MLLHAAALRRRLSHFAVKSSKGCGLVELNHYNQIGENPILQARTISLSIRSNAILQLSMSVSPCVCSISSIAWTVKRSARPSHSQVKCQMHTEKLRTRSRRMEKHSSIDPWSPTWSNACAQHEDWALHSGVEEAQYVKILWIYRGNATLEGWIDECSSMRLQLHKQYKKRKTFSVVLN